MARVWSTGKRKPENITSNETRSAKKPRLWNRELEYKTSDAKGNEKKPKGLLKRYVWIISNILVPKSYSFLKITFLHGNINNP